MTINFAVLQKRFEELQQVRTGGGGSEFWKPTAAPLNQPPYRNVFRLAEAHPNMIERTADGESLWPIVTSRVHFGLGPQQNVMCPCLEFFGQPCEGCRWAEELFARGKTDPRARDMSYRIKAKLNFYAQGVDMRAPASGIRPWSFSSGVEKRVRACFFDNQIPAQPRDITDLQSGRNLIIDVGTKPGRNQGSDTYPDYTSIKADDTVTPWNPAWGEPQDLTQFVWQPTPAQVSAALQGQRVDRQASTTMISGPSAARLSPVPDARVNVTPVPLALVTSPAAPVTAYVPPQAATPQAFTQPPIPAPAPAPAPAPTRGRPRKAATKVDAAPPTAATLTEAQALDAAEAEVRRLGAPIGFTTPIRLAREEINFQDLPPCYGIRPPDPSSQDVADSNCQGCPAIVWCRGVIMGLIPAA